MLCVPLQSFAFGFLLPFIPWLVTGTNLLVTDLVIGQVGVLTSIVYYECNGYSSISTCATGTKSGAAAAASGSPLAGSKPLIIRLQPDAARVNPDATKFNNAAPGARDVTPKATVTPDASTSSAMVKGGEYYSVAVNFYDPNVGWSSKILAGADPAQLASSAVSLTYNVKSNLGCIASDPNAYPYGAGFTCRFTTMDPPVDPSTNTGTRVTYHSTGAPSDCQSGQVYDAGAGCAAANSPISCPVGYKSSGLSCTLIDAAQIKKPAATPCEILNINGSFQTDAANPNCDGSASMIQGAVFTPPSVEGKATTVNQNASGGFDVTQTSADGSSVTASTASYNSSAGGYPIVTTKSSGTSTGTTGTGTTGTTGTGTTGATGTGTTGTTGTGTGNCGGLNQSNCSVYSGIDKETSDTFTGFKSALSSQYETGKSLISGIADDKFQFDFIPHIPTATCVDPTVTNPVTGSQTYTVPICSSFNIFSYFINGVLAVLCMIGISRQIQSAIKA